MYNVYDICMHIKMISSTLHSCFFPLSPSLSTYHHRLGRYGHHLRLAKAHTSHPHLSHHKYRPVSSSSTEAILASKNLDRNITMQKSLSSTEAVQNSRKPGKMNSEKVHSTKNQQCRHQVKPLVYTNQYQK